jgi:hypothetical protein
MVSYVVAGWAIGLSIMLSRAFNLVCPSLHFLPMISCSSDKPNKQKKKKKKKGKMHFFFFFVIKYIRKKKKKKKYNQQPDGW